MMTGASAISLAESPGPIGTGDNRRVTIDKGLSFSGAVDPTRSRPAFVRPATPEDDVLLGRLREQAFADLGPARGGAMYLERHAAELPALRADWSNATRRVWLGGIENIPVGYLLAATVPLPSGAVVGVIEAIYVDRGARACGIGEAMMAVGLDWFRSQGCVGVEATALPGQRATKNFFEEHGLKARLLTVYRSLTDDEPGAD
jgi:GNAT superfamily N-acetyltransferase